MKPKIFAAACLLFLLSLSLQYGGDLVGAKSKVLKAVIVEEGSMRSSLPQQQIITLMKASSLGVYVVDQDIVGPDKKTPPADLVPFLNAAKGKQLPQLARKWSNGRTTSVACPVPFEKLKEAVQ
jgi:hypothetical protein